MNRQTKRRTTRRMLVAAAVILVAAAAVGLGGPARDADDHVRASFTLQELREDFDRATRRMLARHPLLYSDPSRVEAIAARQREKLRDGMSEVEFYRVLAPVVEALECGHSNLQPSAAREARMNELPVLFPLGVRLVQDELVVVEADAAQHVPRGSRIRAINGRPTERIVELMRAGVTSDGVNESSKREKINNQFAYFYHLLVDDSTSFRVSFTERDGGAPRQATLAGSPGNRLYAGPRSLASIGVYLDFEKIRRDYDAEIRDDYAYLRVSSFILDHRAFADFAEEFFTEIDRRGVRRLVVDVRGNWGGPPRSSALLYSYLLAEPAPYLDEDTPFYFFRYKRPTEPQEHAFDGELVVLTDGTVFSTTAHFVSLVRYHDRGLLVGDTAGGSAACTDGSHSIRLGNTGVRLYFSTKAFSTPAPRSRDGAGVEPDLRVEPTVASVLSGRDLTLERAVAELSR